MVGTRRNADGGDIAPAVGAAATSASVTGGADVMARVSPTHHHHHNHDDEAAVAHVARVGEVTMPLLHEAVAWMQETLAGHLATARA